MKIKKVFSILLVLILALNYRYINCYSLNKENIYKEVLESVSTEETFTYLYINWSESFIRDIKKYEEDIENSLKSQGIDIKESLDKEDEYKLEAATLNITKNNESYLFSIKIKLREYDEERVNEFIQKIHKSLSLRRSNLRILINTKAKISNTQKIEDEKNKLEKYLSKNGYHIDTVKIHNGYSTKVSNNSNKTFQYIFSSYDTGNYIVVGHSEIFISY